jgi:ABC-type bacteriocin/lantibiotic exporter with double-glycine peptidase domain
VIDVIGIGLIGPFVAVIGHKGIIVDDYPVLLNIIGNVKNETIIIFMGLILSSTFIIKGFIAFFVQKKILSLGYEIRASIVEKIVKSAQESSYEEISSRDGSKIVVNANTHVGLFIDSIFVPTLRMSIEMIVVIGIFLLMAFTSLLLVSVAALLMIIVLVIYFKFIRVRLTYYGQIMSSKEMALITELNHVMGAFREIRLLGVENFFRDEIKSNVIEFGKAGVITRSLYLISRYAVEASLAVFIASLVVFMIYLSEPIESIYALLSIFAVGCLRLVPSFSAIGSGLANIKTASFALDSLYNELALIDEKVHKPKDVELNNSINFTSLELKNVSYRYQAHPNYQLQDINLYIKKGSFIAISGHSGSGKSTLMDIMIGMLNPSKGKLFVNNIEINGNESISSWQQNCAFIPQNVFLINNSIKKNIALGVKDSNIDYGKLELAISGARLQDVLAQNEMNIDSQVGEAGVKLSGGQRQRVALARALYAERDVIFMDEATSALDKETESEVMKYIGELRGKVTIILITHSMSALKECDQVFKLANGRLTIN